MQTRAMFCGAFGVNGQLARSQMHGAALPQVCCHDIPGAGSGTEIKTVPGAGTGCGGQRAQAKGGACGDFSVHLFCLCPLSMADSHPAIPGRTMCVRGDGARAVFYQQVVPRLSSITWRSCSLVAPSRLKS